MNGICEIKVKGKTYPLRFGMIAIEYLNEKLLGVENNSAMAVHMVYAGMLNHAIANDSSSPDFKTVYGLCELFDEEKDCQEQSAKVSQCFTESKYGAKWMEAIKKTNKELKKKIESIGQELDVSVSESLD